MNNEIIATEPSQSIKSIISQILAGTTQNLMMLDLGISMSFSTIVIPALLGAEGPLSFTEEQASWFGSIAFIIQPIGSLMSGALIEPFGRKRSLLIANIPHILAWLILYFAANTATVFVAFGLLGLGTGIMEAPIMTYIGEISHPSMRGMLTTLSQFCVTFGVFLSYLLGTCFDWRTAAAICLSIPLITFLSIILIPDTPVWLLSKGREGEALKALCWIRGWVEPKDVQKEFDDLIIYQQNSAMCHICKIPTMQCSHKDQGLKDRIMTLLKDITRKEMLRPLLLIIYLFFSYHLVGLLPTRPNMVNIFKCFGFPIDANFATVITGSIALVCVFILIPLIKIFGKRRLLLLSLFACSLCTFLLGLYAYSHIPLNTSSYNIKNTLTLKYSWMAMSLFALYNVFGFSGICVIPWMLVSEIFPLRGRGYACGLTAAIAYIIGFVATKTYYNLETSLGIYGVLWFYCVISIINFIVLYLYLPETEGKSFEEIEKYFMQDKVQIVASDPLTKAIKRLFFKSKHNKVDVYNNSENLTTISNTLK